MNGAFDFAKYKTKVLTLVNDFQNYKVKTQSINFINILLKNQKFTFQEAHKQWLVAFRFFHFLKLSKAILFLQLFHNKV